MLVPEYKTKLVRAMRQQATPSEARLWNALRLRRLNGLYFRRQHPVGRYIVDFVCESCKLVVEVDGTYHDTTAQQELDAERCAFLVGSGYRVLRVRAEDVMSDLLVVLRQIAASVQGDDTQVDASA